MPNETAGPYRVVKRRGALDGMYGIEGPGAPPGSYQHRPSGLINDLNRAHAAARRECAEELLGTDGLIGCTGPECSCPDDDIAERCGLARALAAKRRS